MKLQKWNQAMLFLFEYSCFCIWNLRICVLLENRVDKYTRTILCCDVVLSTCLEILSWAHPNTVRSEQCFIHRGWRIYYCPFRVFLLSFCVFLLYLFVCVWRWQCSFTSFPLFFCLLLESYEPKARARVRARNSYFHSLSFSLSLLWATIDEV